MEISPCNLCGSSSSTLIAKFQDNLFGIPGEFPYVKCNVCGLMYISSRPSEKEISAFYPNDYLPYKTAIQDERFWLMRWARQNNLRKKEKVIQKYLLSNPGNLLDIGSSTGIFLDFMRNNGWKTWGVETNPMAVNYARERLRLEVHEGQFNVYDFSDKTFTLITMWDVLEHAHDPKNYLKSANSLLSDDGILALTLPNWDSLDRKIFGQAWVGYDAPRHLYVFQLPVLKKMFEQTGFKLIHTKSGLGGYYTFLASLRIWLNTKIQNSRLRKFILTLLYFPGVRIIFQPLFSLLDAFNLGGTLVVIACKSNSNQESHDYVHPTE